MALPAIADGSFVWTFFPFGPPHDPTRPGPKRHVGYVLAHDPNRSPPLLLVAYTSSGPWRGDSPSLPLGIMEIGSAEARKLGQRTFHLDITRLAKLPMTRNWFPDLAQPRHGVVGVASPDLMKRIDRAFRDLMTRHRALMSVLGPA